MYAHLQVHSVERLDFVSNAVSRFSFQYDMGGHRLKLKTIFHEVVTVDFIFCTFLGNFIK